MVQPYTKATRTHRTSYPKHKGIVYHDCSLAKLYDKPTMSPELCKAHQQNDLAMMSAYGFDKKITESECVAELMKLYQKLTE